MGSVRACRAEVRVFEQMVAGAAVDVVAAAVRAERLAADCAAHGWWGIFHGLRQAEGILVAIPGAGLAAAGDLCRDVDALLSQVPEAVGRDVVASSLAECLAAVRVLRGRVEEVSGQVAEASGLVALTGVASLAAGLLILRNRIGDLLMTIDTFQEDLGEEVVTAAGFGVVGGPGNGAGAAVSGPRLEPPEIDRWADPEAQKRWVQERLADPGNTQRVTSARDWARYQRRVAGDVEVRIGPRADQIWADGVALDPDGVVAVEAKYVGRPGHSMYEGKAPPAILDTLLEEFDDETERYGGVIHDPDNPVRRLRIVTNTRESVEFLRLRARRILGPAVDVDVRYEP